MKKKRTLRSQFNIRLFIILISITLISGLVQVFVINKQVKENVERDARMISESIQQGITETDLASRAIEQQIDFKLESILKRINDQLPRELDNITNEQLSELQQANEIAGIDIFSYDDEGIISVIKSTEPDELGFTFKGINDQGYAVQEGLYTGQEMDVEGLASYYSDNIIVLYTAQAGSREEPQFFKYAYYYEPGAEYFISIFIEANEVYQFTQQVGPSAWIENVLSEHEYAKEIAVLDPRVFADPSLAEAIYPPLQKVVYGNYNYETDEDVLIGLADNPKEVTMIDKHDGKDIYKMFIPYDEGKVIYVAMDYEKMAAPFTSYSLLLIAFGFVALLVLFLTTTQFFNKIYTNIAKIITQIKSLETGDFTKRSDVKDGGELEQLSQSTNRMADTLNEVLGQTKEQAVQTERHAYMLESEANNSVEKVYTMSMEATTESREKTDEIYYIIEQIEKLLVEGNIQEKDVLERLTQVRELVQNQSNSTTEMTITLSDLLKSLHGQSSSLSEISKKLLRNLDKFELKETSQNEE
ncbi:methyl-accepting chemotaxis protein [Ornithinibacillus contaminans]|uniref:methyl-accepting chemotaxis protein n=1 Tax=Ornithinibacillus contaminans TaxID=694055 RepID=UPI00064DACEE|nr:methyl-accepting chemotaxis protein [Ornithinibacillus contaminans]